MSPSNSPRPYSNGRPSLFNNNSGKNMKRTYKDSNYVTRNTGGERAGAATFFHNHHTPTSVGAAVTVSSHHTIPPPPQRKRTVQFHEKVTVYFPNSWRMESTTNNNHDATYLSMNDLTNIQNDIFLTLDYLHVTRTADPEHGPEQRPVRHPAFVCARGLEDYSTHTKGHLKASTLSRRQRAVFAVLQEQEYQQHELQRNPRNDDTLRRVYEQYTIPNAIHATKLGREDSEAAFKIYAEDKQQQHEQRQEEQQHQYQHQQLWHQRPQPPQLWRQQEPHTQRNYQQGSKKKDVPPTMPRRYGTDSPMIPVEQPKQQQQQPQPPHHWNFNFQYQEEPPPPFFRCNSSSSSLFSSFGSSFKDNSSSHNHQMIVEWIENNS